MLWKISLRGIWLLRRVGFKESEALLLFVILKFKFPRKCTNRSDMIPKRRHPLLHTNSHNVGRRSCNTLSNLEHHYVGDSFVRAFLFMIACLYECTYFQYSLFKSFVLHAVKIRCCRFRGTMLNIWQTGEERLHIQNQTWVVRI